MDAPIARLLTPDGAEAYARLRRAMLIDVPRAFASSPGEAHGEKPEAIVEYLADPCQAIAVVDHPHKPGELAAAAGIMRMKHRKMNHRVNIWGVYCVPELRGQGLGRAAMVRAIERARDWDGVEVIGLSVSARSPGALALYESLGFVRWGLEPDAMRIDGEAFDEVHLALRL
jgi:RimJ/RimL family protein N-acetyltransferase